MRLVGKEGGAYRSRTAFATVGEKSSHESGQKVDHGGAAVFVFPQVCAHPLLPQGISQASITDTESGMQCVARLAHLCGGGYLGCHLHSAGVRFDSLAEEIFTSRKETSDLKPGDVASGPAEDVAPP